MRFIHTLLIEKNLKFDEILIFEGKWIMARLRFNKNLNKITFIEIFFNSDLPLRENIF